MCAYIIKLIFFNVLSLLLLFFFYMVKILTHNLKMYNLVIEIKELRQRKMYFSI